MSFLISSVDRIFNGFFYRHADSFSSLQTNIRKAHINVPVNQYISRAFLYSAFASILALIICLISVIKIFDIIDTPDVNIGTGALSGWIELHICELIHDFQETRFYYHLNPTHLYRGRYIQYV